MYIVLFSGLALVALGIFALFYAVPAELLQKKILGLGLSAVGFFLVFKFPEQWTSRDPASAIQASLSSFHACRRLFLFIF